MRRKKIYHQRILCDLALNFQNTDQKKCMRDSAENLWFNLGSGRCDNEGIFEQTSCSSFANKLFVR